MSEEINIKSVTNICVNKKANSLSPGFEVKLTIDYLKDLIEEIGVDKILEEINPTDIANFFNSYRREAEAKELVFGLPYRVLREYYETHFLKLEEE